MKTRLTIFVFLLVLSYYANQKFFYEPYIVSCLSTWKEVPLILWVISFLPELTISIIAALKSRSTIEWILFCLLGALSLTSFQWILGYLNHPGKQKIIEGGIFHFMIQFIIITVLLAIVVGTIRLAKYLIKARDKTS